jgi:hypothetical protein
MLNQVPFSRSLHRSLHQLKDPGEPLSHDAKRPMPTQSTCLYYCHDNEASKSVNVKGRMYQLSHPLFSGGIIHLPLPHSHPRNACSTSLNILMEAPTTCPHDNRRGVGERGERWMVKRAVDDGEGEGGAERRQIGGRNVKVDSRRDSRTHAGSKFPSADLR